MLTAIGLLAGMVVLFPFDGAISDATRSLRLSGDLKRELGVVQQYGDLICVGLVILLVCILDPARRARVPRATLAVAASSTGTWVLKMLVGRPRPSLGDPAAFLGPLQEYPVHGQLRHAWTFWEHGASSLWSMPSGHTSAAAALSVALTWLYPRYFPVGIVLTVLVGVARVLTGAHYPSDVLAGAAVGLAVAGFVLRTRHSDTDPALPTPTPTSHATPPG